MFSSGLQGGVKVTKDIESIAELSRKMIGHKLKTKQTAGDGVTVNKVNWVISDQKHWSV